MDVAGDFLSGGTLLLDRGGSACLNRFFGG
jgi:hypothetical protein